MTLADSVVLNDNLYMTYSFLKKIMYVKLNYSWLITVGMDLFNILLSTLLFNKKHDIKCNSGS